MMRSRAFLFSWCLLALAGCNIYGGLDKPRSDAQRLSAARAAFDQGNLDEALELYGQLADNESARADEAFVILNQNDIGMRAFAKAITISSGDHMGSILTELVEAAAPGAGAAKRAALLTAYSKVASLSNSSLKGFVRFFTAMALAAELIAEDACVSADYVWSSGDVVDTANQSACLSGTVAQCVTTCSGSAMNGTGGTYDSTTFITDPANATIATPTKWQGVLTALNAANVGLSEMGVTSGDSFQLVSQLVALAGSGTLNIAMRGALLEMGAGR